MIRYLLVSVGSGVLFGIMDAIINANPLAQRLFEVYKPIARTSVNPVLGIGIDIAYGFIMAGIFLLLYKSLPGKTGLLKGACFGVLVWFFRVVMHAASQWMMFTVTPAALYYSLLAGLMEMLVLGALYGTTSKPTIRANTDCL